MDRMNNNFNPFDFDVEAFTRAYYQQGAGQQSEDARQRTSFEEQLGELKLGSSGESSGENGSLAAFSGECSGGVRRDMGASMRTPPRFASSDSSSNSSRHSVDIPDPVSSPEIQTKKGKKRGMWSRIKSGVGKSFSGSHSEKAFGAPKQQEVVSTNVQVSYVKHRESRLGAFEEDEVLVRMLLNTNTNWSDRTIRAIRADVRKVSAWLHMTGREPVAGRLGIGVDEAEFDPGLEQDLQAYKMITKDGSKRIRSSLKKLQLGTNRLPPPPPPPRSALSRRRETHQTVG
ncbi:hypothetical protein HFN76_36515 [Rhizobium laguerreae]|uniref:hypothetical protein n=1 Tax=Rhizobium laguerreae TaxID=1076926 RepID=UPI001C8FAB1C|nr:hypothetical protein [Rhizobium laguerreae]MBY3517499.1 hypothetical protein [Rhizobium laguerreae]